MTSPAETAASTGLDVSRMSRVQKLAALLIILGPESAAEILKSLDPHDLEAVSVEMARLPMITAEMRTAVLNEMSEVAMAATNSIRGGVAFAQSALERAVGAGKATDILERVSPHRMNSPAVIQLQDMDVRHIFNLLKGEHPQTLALVVSYLRPERASELLCLLRSEFRDQVIERLATMEATPVEVLERVVEVMQRRLSGRPIRSLAQTGGVKSAADVLNALKKDVSKSIISSLEERNAELGLAIRQKMFTFADLIQLDTMALQKVLREIDMRDMALALKKADEALKAKLLGAVSKRAAETINEEISFLGAVKLKEIEAAQLRMVEVVRRLEDEGEIEIEAAPEAAAA